MKGLGSIWNPGQNPAQKRVLSVQDLSGFPGRAIALYMADLISIPDTWCGPMGSLGVIPGHHLVWPSQ